MSEFLTTHRELATRILRGTVPAHEVTPAWRGEELFLLSHRMSEVDNDPITFEEQNAEIKKLIKKPDEATPMARLQHSRWGELEVGPDLLGAFAIFGGYPDDGDREFRLNYLMGSERGVLYAPPDRRLLGMLGVFYDFGSPSRYVEAQFLITEANTGARQFQDVQVAVATELNGTVVPEPEQELVAGLPYSTLTATQEVDDQQRLTPNAIHSLAEVVTRTLAAYDRLIL